MIYKRGNIYWAKFKRNGKPIQSSLKTSDLKTARKREKELKRSHDAMQEPAAVLGMALAELSAPSRENLTDKEIAALARKMLSGMRHRAKKKGLICTHDQQSVEDLIRDAGGLCSVTGMPLDAKSKVSDCRVSPWMPSIDRIDSTKGYTRGNCRIVCYLANIAMSQFGEHALVLLLNFYTSNKLRRSA